ncbi:hypothetical protein CN376_22860 [Bacillus cereus]|nr:hypothetical protein CN376_22860 [Bacillus cereus]PFR12642.1 hypothetical protein COK30_13930 [Bacillus cereus]
MRYTRTRQMAKLNKNWRGIENIPIDIACKFVCPEDLDPTFKWHHDFVWEIEKYWESYITLGTYGQGDFKIIPIK